MKCLGAQTRPTRLIEIDAFAHPAVTRRDDGPARGTERWHVLHTRPRQEKALARALGAAGVHHELPLTNRTTTYGHRRRTVSVPLFPSYLFMRGPSEATYVATATHRVVGVLDVADQGRFDHELTQIRTALEVGAELNPEDELAVGRRVRVRHGPFRDIEGIIEERSGRERLVLQIAALGRATSLEIDAALLEPVD